MKTIFAVLAIVPLLGAPTQAQETPFGVPGPQAPGATKPELTPSLGDIMASAQVRHLKLWYAAKAENWPLVKYEIEQLQDSFIKAAVLYANIPVSYINMVTAPLSDLRAASAEKSMRRFDAGYSKLTVACNACHAAADVAFIRMQTPDRNAPGAKSPGDLSLGNQNFKPPGR